MGEAEQGFNDYCKKVMGYTRTCPTNYNPYVDLNAMADVVAEISVLSKYEADYKELVNDLVLNIPIDIKQSFRDFICSTVKDKK